MEELLNDTTQIISLLVGFVIPLLVGLLSKLNASSKLKAIFNFGLSALSSALTTLAVDFTWPSFVVTFVLTWAASIASYYGLWKPTHTAEVIQVKTANIGVGGTRMQREDHAY